MESRAEVRGWMGAPYGPSARALVENADEAGKVPRYRVHTRRRPCSEVRDDAQARRIFRRLRVGEDYFSRGIVQAERECGGGGTRVQRSEVGWVLERKNASWLTPSWL